MPIYVCSVHSHNDNAKYSHKAKLPSVYATHELNYREEKTISLLLLLLFVAFIVASLSSVIRCCDI